MRIRNNMPQDVVCGVCGMTVKTGIAECPHFTHPVHCGLQPLVEQDRPTKVKGLSQKEIDALAASVSPGPIFAWKNSAEFLPAGYDDLARVLHATLEQAATGKGRERHNRTGKKAFRRQPIMEISRMVGVGGPAFQVMKKTQEACGLPRDRAIAECYGAIVYAAAMVLLLEEQEQDQ